MVDMGLSNVRVFVRFYKMIDIAISQNRKRDQYGIRANI